MPNDVRFSESERVLLVTGTQHGRQEHHPPADRALRRARADGRVRPGGRRRDRRRGPALHPRGRQRQPGAGPEHLHGRDGETSAILHNATASSLVLLDEIGRGTSTYDGVAIAWAVSEHLHDRVGCKTMFATHYHELMQLPERLAHARNLNVAVRETGDDGSLPPPARSRRHRPVVRRPCGAARRPPGHRCGPGRGPCCGTLEGTHRMVPGAPLPAPDPTQLPLFNEPAPHPALEALRALDVSNMTPLEALNRLAELQNKAGRQGSGAAGQSGFVLSCFRGFSHGALMHRLTVAGRRVARPRVQQGPGWHHQAARGHAAAALISRATSRPWRSTPRRRWSIRRRSSTRASRAP